MRTPGALDPAQKELPPKKDHESTELHANVASDKLTFEFTATSKQEMPSTSEVACDRQEENLASP